VILHIFWDWNGTLSDDAGLLRQTVNTAMSAIGHPHVSAELLRARFTGPLSALFGSLTDGRHEDQWPAWHAAFIAAADSEVPPLLAADAVTAVQRWHAAKRTQSVLSRWLAGDLSVKVGATALPPYLDGIRGANWPGEPKEEMLRGELALRGLDPGQALLIGDTEEDAAAAGAVGTRVILCDAHSFAAGIDVASGIDVARGIDHTPRAPSLSAAVDLALAM
jgi:phosphoglycolate phosphatase-like HAD superfamily hydrolase